MKRFFRIATSVRNAGHLDQVRRKLLLCRHTETETEERLMQQIAPHATRPLPAESGTPALPVPLQHRPLPLRARAPRLIRALLWLFRLLFVQPVGRRARAERLRALPDRTLRDIGLRRADVQAVASGLVRLCDLVRAYPSAGPLYVCGRPGFRPTVVRVSEAA
jgi:uncharacterized protein YjiS (DUF1127 family)